MAWGMHCVLTWVTAVGFKIRRRRAGAADHGHADRGTAGSGSTTEVEWVVDGGFLASRAVDLRLGAGASASSTSQRRS